MPCLLGIITHPSPKWSSSAAALTVVMPRLSSPLASFRREPDASSPSLPKYKLQISRLPSDFFSAPILWIEIEGKVPHSPWYSKLTLEKSLPRHLQLLPDPSYHQMGGDDEGWWVTPLVFSSFWNPASSYCTSSWNMTSVYLIVPQLNFHFNTLLNFN